MKMSIAHLDEDLIGSPVNLDPTIPAPMTNVAEYGFEGRFEAWAEDARYFEYSNAANPIGSGHTSKIPIRRSAANSTPTAPLESSRWICQMNWASTADPRQARR